MVNKKMLGLTAALALAAGAVTLLDFNKDKPIDNRLGAVVFTAEQFREVDKVSLVKGDTKLDLVKGETGRWFIGESAGFPVDASKVARFVDDLSKVKFDKVAGTKKEQFAEFGIDAPLELLLSKAGTVQAELRFGNNRTGGGQYFRVGDESTVFLASTGLRVTPDPVAWELKTLINIEPKDIQTVAFEPAKSLGKKPVSMTRSKAEDQLAVTGLPEGGKESGTAKGVERTLVNVTFSNRHDLGNVEAETAMQSPSVATVTLFDGRVYKVQVGEVGDKQKKYFTRIEGIRGPATLSPEDNAELTLLNEIMAKNAFEIPSYIADRLRYGYDDLVEKETSANTAKDSKKG